MIQAMSATTTAVDICVLGDGPVALLAVLSARRQGLTVLHLTEQRSQGESAQRAQNYARNYALSPVSQAGLAALGVWGLLDSKRIQTCTQMRVAWEHQPQGVAFATPPEWIHLDAVAAGVPQLCSFVMESDLLHAIRTALNVVGAADSRVTYPTNARPVLVGTPTGVQISVNQHTYLAKLCVIAQGVNSPAAAALGLAPTVFDYQHTAVVTELACALPHAGCAWQWLGGAEDQDVLALLPAPSVASDAENLEKSHPDKLHRFSLVWSLPTAQAQNYVPNTPEAQRALLAAVNARCAACVGELSLAGAVHSFPLSQASTRQLSAGHVVLLGDSAHKIHPLAGQGLNLGLEDVFTLFDVIAQREPWRDLADARVLARYERRRRGAVGVVQFVVHALARRHDWPVWFQQAAGLDRKSVV